MEWCSCSFSSIVAPWFGVLFFWNMYVPKLGSSKCKETIDSCHLKTGFIFVSVLLFLQISTWVTDNGMECKIRKSSYPPFYIVVHPSLDNTLVFTNVKTLLYLAALRLPADMIPRYLQSSILKLSHLHQRERFHSCLIDIRRVFRLVTRPRNHQDSTDNLYNRLDAVVYALSNQLY